MAVFITVRNKVAKVMFLHLSFCSRGGVVCLSACWDTPPPGADTPSLWEQTSPQEQTPPGSRHPPGADNPPPTDSYCCRRYASYWNAFLFREVESQATTKSNFPYKWGMGLCNSIRDGIHLCTGNGHDLGLTGLTNINKHDVYYMHRRLEQYNFLNTTPWTNKSLILLFAHCHWSILFSIRY